MDLVYAQRGVLNKERCTRDVFKKGLNRERDKKNAGLWKKIMSLLLCNCVMVVFIVYN